MVDLINMTSLSFEFGLKQCRYVVILVSLFLASICNAEARAFKVSSAIELQEALLAATGGDQIFLAAGNYGALKLNGKKNSAFNFIQPIEILAGNFAQKPVFTELDIIKVSNLKLNGLIFDYAFSSADPPALRAASIRDSQFIALVNCIFDGDVAKDTGTFADGYGTGIGLGVTDSKSIKLEGNLFKTWLRGAVFKSVSGLIVKNNEVTAIRSDGFDFVEITNGQIEGNHIHDFNKAPDSKDHRDMIQFWTKGTQIPSSNIVIRNNFLDAGTGSSTQSIFMRNEAVDVGGGGPGMFYRNIRIEGNLIRNAHLNGIAVGETKKLAILRNTLLQAKSETEGGKVSVPSVLVAESSIDVSVEGNLVARLGHIFDTPPIGWTVSHNIVAQRKNAVAAGYYGKIFVNALADKTMNRGDLAILPESELAGMAVGSPLNTFNATPELPVGLILNTEGDGGVLHQKITLSQAYGPLGPIDMSASTVSWKFGDGTTGSGRSAKHEYRAAGKYNVTALLSLPNQKPIICERTILVGY
jgi:Right handed beta helix region/PKD domain